MGMFDTIIVECPVCGEELDFQTKSGPCSLRYETLKDCPEDMLQDVNRHSPCECSCGASIEVDKEARKPNVLSIPKLIDEGDTEALQALELLRFRGFYVTLKPLKS